MANVYEYTMINQSPTLDVVIGAKITEAPCKAVKLCFLLPGKSPWESS